MRGTVHNEGPIFSLGGAVSGASIHTLGGATDGDAVEDPVDLFPINYQ